MKTEKLDSPTPGPWHWHDTFGRLDGKGEPLGIGRGVTGDEPEIGNCSRFSFAVSDAQGFCVAHCTGSLVTMSSDRSEANARLIAKAPQLLASLKLCVARLEEYGDAEGGTALDLARRDIAEVEGK